MTTYDEIRHELDRRHLRGELSGDLVLPGDHGWELARSAWNLEVDQHPAAVVLAENPADVQATVRAAAAAGLGVAVQSTGHGISRSCDSGVLVNTRRMTGVTVDPGSRRARVDAGAVWHDLVTAAAVHGLAGLPGSSTGVGVVGYTLGGGFGWLGRRYGLAAHSLTRAQVVTADGAVRTADADRETELFWGLQGGTGNFGIVTSLEFRLHPVSDVYAGNLYHPLSRARDVLELFAEWTREAPADLTAAATFRRFPPSTAIPETLRGGSFVALRGCWAGDPAEGAALVDRARRTLGPSVVDTWTTMPASDLATISADPVEPLGAVQHSETLTHVSPGVVDLLVEMAGPGADSPLVMLELRTLGGALAGPEGALSPMAHTRGQASVNAIGVTTAPGAQPDRIRAHLRELERQLRPHATGDTYVNFLDLDGATPERIRAAYSPEDRRRLARLKAAVDPDDLFRFSRAVPLDRPATTTIDTKGTIMTSTSMTSTTMISTSTSSPTARTVLVTGATGNVGAEVVRHLLARGIRPRALVRDLDRARALLGDGAELAVGDLADASAVRNALDGVGTVFLACGNVPDQIDLECGLIDAARAAGVSRIVKLSARGADRDATNAYWRRHAAIEAHLEESGIPAVVLRPSFLMSNLFAAAQHVRTMDSVMAPAGSARIAMVDPADVAEVAAVALTDHSVAPGVLVLTGPEAISYAEVTDELSAVVGRPLTYVDVPPEAMVGGLVGAGVPEVAALEVVRVFDALRAGRQDTTTDTVHRVTGHRPGSFGAMARRHATVFTGDGPGQPSGGAYVNEFYSERAHGPYDLYEVGDVDLEGGGHIPRLQLAYATHGTLNAAKDNAILVPTWFSGTHADWTRAYIGEGRALDPARYFIVVVNQIGNGLSTSPHTTPDAGIAMSKFPAVSVGDDVRAQHALLTELFGIERLQLVVGASMGAQQVYEWAVAYPDMVLRAAPLAGTARTTPHARLVTRTLMEAISSDPGWAEGHYASNLDVRAGLLRHAGLWAVLGLSTEFWKREMWRDIAPVDGGAPYRDLLEFQHRFLGELFAAMDPHALLTMATKWQDADVARHTGGDLAAALARITARTVVMAIDEDLVFPLRDLAFEQGMVAGSDLRVLHSLAGHVGVFGLEPAFLDQVDRVLRELLATDGRGSDVSPAPDGVSAPLVDA